MPDRPADLRQTRETLGLKCPVCVDDAAVAAALLEIERVEARLLAEAAADLSDIRDPRILLAEYERRAEKGERGPYGLWERDGE